MFAPSRARREYEPIAERFGVPIVVAGFEPVDILQGIYQCLAQLQQGRAKVENAYGRMVRRGGKRHAQNMMQHIFLVEPQRWRGIGEIPQSGLGLASTWSRFDALTKFCYDAPEVPVAGPKNQR